MKKLFILAIALIMTLSDSLFAKGTKQQGLPAKPDFAYPATVTKDAETRLKAALRSGDGRATVRALADIALAQSAIGNEKLPPIVSRIEQIRDKETDGITRSLLDMLLADIYFDIYMSDKWTYDRRELPLSPLPADYTEWSGAQYRSRINSLCDEALSHAQLLKKAPIADYASIISADRQTRVFYPTLYDFAASFTIGVRKQLTPFSNIFSLLYLSPRTVFSSTTMTIPSSPAATAVLRTYADWLRFHEGETAPTVNIDLRRIATVSNGLYRTVSREKADNRKAELLLALYDQFRTSEYSGLVLLEMAQMQDYRTHINETKAKKLASMLRDNIARFPSFFRVDCLKNALTDLTEKTLHFSLPNCVAPGNEFKIGISGANTKSLTIDFYRVTLKGRGDNYYRRGSGSETLAKSLTVNFSGDAPFRIDTIVSATLPSEGYYIAVPRGKTEKGNSYEIIRSSRLALGAAMLDNNGCLYAIDPMTGKPVDGATIMRNASGTRKPDFVSQGLTDSDGFFPLSVDKFAVYAVEKGSDRYADTRGIGRTDSSQRADTMLMSLTDLSIYHPGDTVRFAVVAYTARKDDKRPLASAEIAATLKLANGTEGGSTKVTTDDFGRATGSLVIPENGLTGYAHIQFNTDGAFNGISFMVSDYKLPTFAVSISAADRNTPAEGDVTLRGTARTYSGIAVADASVRLDLSVAQPVWWMRTNAVRFYSAEATTDADGAFTIEIPAAVMEAGPAPRGFYTALVSVTSQDGETHQTSRAYTLGPTYSIVASLPRDIDASTNTPLNLRVVDGEGKSVDKTVCWTLKSLADSTEHSGSFSSAHPVIDFRSIPSGSYSASFIIEGSDPATAVSENSLVIYRPDDRLSPSSDLIWAPADGSTQTVDKRRTYSLLYATAKPEEHLLYILCSNESGRILERRWIHAEAGMHRLDIKLPADIDKVSAILSTVSGFATSTVSLTVMTPAADPQLTIMTESFRDRIVPGEEETWSFRTVNRDSAAVHSAMMLNMYNAALQGIDGLRFNPWQLNPSDQYFPTLSFSAPALQGVSYGNISGRASAMRQCPQLDAPEWILYGRSFNSARNLHYKMVSFNTMARAASGAAVAEMSVEESADDVIDAREHKEDITDRVMDGAADTGAAEQPSAEPEFAYRDSEVASAFFSPMLTTGSDGQLTYTFSVPDANTTWSFGALAYDSRMTTSSINREVIANKPVMVQPNLPRFLRAGDCATVKATVINNSEAEQTVATIVEIFDIATGRQISARTFSSVIAPGSSTVVSSELTAPLDAPFIGYRIKSSAGTHADGEQAAIQILPFTTPVIETKPFYMPTDTGMISLRLPAMPADARVTLQYCDNPLWYVVTALPGLRESDPRTSVDAASAIYSAAIADGLLRSNPEIARVLREWTSGDRSDSTLVSMLSRNADLKTVLLDATPWMLDARSDTERMERLALLFDRRQIDEVYDKAVATLEKLRCDNGGFAWSTYWKEPSEWATRNLLCALGDLNRLGYLPDIKKLREWINPALEYVQAETVREWRRDPQAMRPDFVSLVDLWPDFKPSAAAQSIIAQTVQQTIVRWKKFDIGGKARAAVMLAHHGHPATARELLRSLREYAVSSPTEGMYWPSVGDAAGGSMWQLDVSASALDAFALLDPESPDIDSIRQWLILQKETRNWGSSATASRVIAALLGTSKKWIKPAGAFEITVGGREVVPAAVEKTLGYFRTDISQLAPSGAELTISKTDRTPAWGAVYCQYTDAITNVRAESCDALSIEKRLLKQVGTEWIETTDVAVGDRVRVLLTVHANRDLEYVAVTDDRAACLEPVDQLPSPLYSEGICFYRENRDTRTNLFVGSMPKGTYQLSYDLWVNNAGTFASGLATAQSQYAPQFTAHSAGSILTSR